MARTVGQVISQARILLQDSNNAATGGYRHSDNDLAFLVSEAVQEARRLRPDLFITYGLDVAIPVYTSGDLSTNLPLPDIYFTPIINLVVGRAQLREDEFSSDGRAATLMTLFSASLTSNGGKQ